MLFSGRFYAPVYTAILVIVGMLIIFCIETLGISHRTKNIELRGPNKIVLKSNNYNIDQYSEVNLSDCKMKLEIDIETEKINKINEILLSSIS